LKKTKLIAMFVILSIAATPVLSFARAGGGSRGGGYSSGSSGSSGGSIGSRGSRTYDNNGNSPIQRSTTPQQTPSSAATAQPAPQPASQPSFFMRHPILTGLAAGFAGSWIGHMLFGSNNTMAASGDAVTGEGGSGGSLFMLLFLLVLGGGALYYFMKIRRQPRLASAGPAIGRLSSRDAVAERDIETIPVTRGGFMSQSGLAELATSVSREDQERFKQILVEIQNAWSKQDLDTLKRLTTPEMLHYFSQALSENASAEKENHVEDVGIVSAEVKEVWTEDMVDYATVLLRWKARDYTVALNKRPGDPGYVIEGDQRNPVEVAEAWTFMRYRNGKWLLSAIQQVD
jgi:predicted lipid-binding transport protein (Tim44 family)